MANAQRVYRSAEVWLVSLAAVAMIFGAALAYAITRSITGPIRRSVAVAEAVARGDLSTIINMTGRDEMGQLLAALRHMNERLVELVGRVLTSSDDIATASSQIAAGNVDLSERTETQAAALQQTAASMEELAVTVRQNAEHASRGNALVAQAASTAEGGEVTEHVVVHDARNIRKFRAGSADHRCDRRLRLSRQTSSR